MKQPKSTLVQLNYKEIKKLYKHLKKQIKTNEIDDTTIVRLTFSPTGIGTDINANYEKGNSTESLNITDHTSW